MTTRNKRILLGVAALAGVLLLGGWIYANRQLSALVDDALARARSQGVDVTYKMRTVNVLSSQMVQFQKLTLQTPQGETKIDSAALSPLPGHWWDFPDAARVELRGARLPLPQAPAEGQAFLDALEMEEILADCDMRYVHDPGARTVELQELTVNTHGLYRLTFDGAFQNLPPDLDGGPESPRAREAMKEMTTTGMALELEDRGLVDKLFTAYAAANGNAANAPLLRRIVTGFAKNLAGELFPAADQDLLERIHAFLDDPKLAGLRLRCQRPLTLDAIDDLPVDSQDVTILAKLETARTLGTTEYFDAKPLLRRGE